MSPDTRREPSLGLGFSGLLSDERGTSALEAVAVMPVLFLVFGLSFNLAYGGAASQRAAVAARVAAREFTMHASCRGTAGSAQETATSRVKEKLYRGSLVLISYTGRHPGMPGDVSGSNGGASALLGAFSAVIGGVSLDLRASLHPPFNTGFSGGSAAAHDVFPGSTWSFRDVPLSPQSLLGQLGGDGPWGRFLGVLGAAGKGIAWPMGMIGQDDRSEQARCAG